MIPPNEYPQGTLVRAQVAVVNATSMTPQDPSALFFVLEAPGGAPVVYQYGSSAIVKDGVGQYHFDVDTTPVGGNWLGRWYATGVGQFSVPWAIFVIANPF